MRDVRIFFFICVVLSLGLVLITAVPTISTTDIPEEVVAGLNVWRVNGCESCHTLYGHGGAYAPDLTHIASTRGEDYLREFLIDPAAFYPNQRLMPQFTLSVDERTSLIAFLNWINAHPTSEAFPPRTINIIGGGTVPVVAIDTQSDEPSVDNQQIEAGRLIYSQRCASCHSLDIAVTSLPGPPLADIGHRAGIRVLGQTAEEYLRNSVLNPSDYIVEGYQDLMQKNLGELLSTQELDNLIAFLMTLREDES